MILPLKRVTGLFFLSMAVFGSFLYLLALPAVHADGVVGDGTPVSCTELELRATLALGGYVTFACGPAPLTIPIRWSLMITEDTTLDGGRLITLLGAGFERVFTVEANTTFTLTQMTISRGNAYEGGGILNNGTVLLHNVTFSNNFADMGGGIMNYGVVQISDSEFTHNVAYGAFGGAITNYGVMEIQGSTFNHNTAGINGGAIDTTMTLIITDTVFTSNQATHRGGAINNYLGQLQVSNSHFSDNFAGQYGGGLANDDGTTQIKASSFVANLTNGTGGGISNNGIITLTNSTVSGNRSLSHGASDGTGGGISSRQRLNGPHHIWILYSTIAYNTATGTGGNLFLEVNDVTLSSSVVANGQPNNCSRPLISLGYNLETEDTCGLTAVGDQTNAYPGLGTLALGGGISWYHPLFPGSRAIDTGTNVDCPPHDQRGFLRPVDGDQDGIFVCDMGAYEYFGPLFSFYLPTIVR